MKRLIPPALMLLLLAGCGKADNTAQPVHNNSAAPPQEITAIPEDQDALAANEDEGGASVVSGWSGHWNGPEGLFLDIAPQPDKAGHYALTIKDNLDRQAKYSGVAKGETIAFIRDGKPFTIRAGSGDETGFKYLAGKQDCLIVVAGKEGYCRD